MTQFSMTATAASGESQFERLETAPLKQGFHPVTLYQILDLGTIEKGGKYPGKKRMVRFGFETPLETRIFTAGDEPRPCVVNFKKPFIMHEKGGLTLMLNQMIGRTLQPSEYDTFNIASLLGKQFMVNIVHAPSQDPKRPWQNIQSIQPLTDDLKAQMNFDWSKVAPVNDPQFFFLGKPVRLETFNTPMFGALTKYWRAELEKCDEAIKWAAQGGEFYPKAEWKKPEPEQASPEGQASTQQAQAPAQAPATNPNQSGAFTDPNAFEPDDLPF